MRIRITLLLMHKSRYRKMLLPFYCTEIKVTIIDLELKITIYGKSLNIVHIWRQFFYIKVRKRPQKLKYYMF